jgi:hypothetical protein
MNNSNHWHQQNKVSSNVGIYTLRTAHQNQTQLVIMADQKANILIGIAAVIFSILFTNTNFLADIPEKLLMPFTCFLTMELVAIFLALLVVLPKNVIRFKPVNMTNTPNLLFFEAFTNYKEDEYVTSLSAKLHNDQSAIDLLIVDFYRMGIVLRKKYALLKYAYMFAAIGIVLPLFFAAIFFFMD